MRKFVENEQTERNGINSNKIEICFLKRNKRKDKQNEFKFENST